jgi:hypothetical protein
MTKNIFHIRDQKLFIRQYDDDRCSRWFLIPVNRSSPQLVVLCVRRKEFCSKTGLVRSFDAKKNELTKKFPDLSISRQTTLLTFTVFFSCFERAINQICEFRKTKLTVSKQISHMRLVGHLRFSFFNQSKYRLKKSRLGSILLRESPDW